MNHPNLALTPPASARPVVTPTRPAEGLRAALQTWCERVLVVLAMILLGNGMVHVLQAVSSQRSLRAGQAVEQNAASYPLNR